MKVFNKFYAVFFLMLGAASSGHGQSDFKTGYACDNIDIQSLIENGTGGTASLPTTRSMALERSAGSAPETMSAMGMASAPLAISADIQELAQALQYDPVKIFNFVRNEIGFDLQYGWIRSPERTVLDGMGTDADQAVLLHDLLYASGYTDIAYGKGNLWYAETGNDGYNVADWMGFPPDALYAFSYLVERGIPCMTDPSNNYLLLERFWVNVKIGTKYWNLDPVATPCKGATPPDIKDLAGYGRADLLAALGGTGDSNSVSSASDAGLRGYLNSLASTLADALKSDYPAALAGEVFGNKTIEPTEGLYNIRYYATGSYDFYSSMYDIADRHFIEFKDTVNSFHVSTVYLGKDPLSFSVDADGLNGSIIIGTNVFYSGYPVTDGNGLCHISYERPKMVYDSSNNVWNLENIPQVKAYPVPPLTKVALAVSYGNSPAEGVVELRNAELSRMVAEGAPADLSAYATLHSIGASWMKQESLFIDLFNSFYGYDQYRHFRMGAFKEYPLGYGIDIPHGYAQVLDAGPEYEPLFKGPQFFASALEHGVLEQSQPGSADAVSTIELIAQFARSGNGQFYRIDSSNFSSVTNVLENYSDTSLGLIAQQVLGLGGTAFVPQNALITNNLWKGAGFIASSPVSIGFHISGGLLGGEETTGAKLDPALKDKANKPNTLESTNKDNPLSDEPVDMVTGAYVFDHIDLEMGGPAGIRLSRQYSSKTRNNRTGLGYGWNHSLNMHISESSEPDAMLGQSTPEEAAAMAVAVSAVKDLLENEDTAKGWLAASLTAKWAMDQLTDNAVTVVSGRKATTFLKKPDGSFMPPPGITASLIKTNGTYVMQERHGNTYAFNTNGLIETVSDPHGNTLSFDYAGETNLQYVTSSFGPQFTFGYTGGLLTSVADNSTPSRAVQYEYDGNNNLTNFTDAAGFGWGITYDDDRKIKTLVDPEGITTIQNFYNSIGQVTNQVSATGHPWNFYFAGTRNVEEDPLGNQTAYHIDGLQRTWSVERADGSRTYTFFDGQNHVTNAISAAGVTNLFVYDTDHNLLAQTNAVGTAEQVANAFGYDAEHRLRFVTNAVGTAEQAVTEFTYTAQHKVDTVTVAKGTPVETVADYDYTAEGLVQQVSEGNGKRITTYSNFDSYGNAQTIQSTDAGTVGRTFDIRGDLKALTVDGKTTEFAYDARRLPTGTTYAKGMADEVATSKTYWKNGLLKTVTDARGKTSATYWTSAYKSAGLLLPNAGSTTNLYDDADRMVMSRDSEGNWATNTLDSVGQPVFISTATATVYNEFDAVGNLTYSSVDPYALDLWAWSDYDALNRLIYRESDLAGREFEYDALGRQTNTVDAAEKSWKTQYDALGRVKKSYRPSNNYEEYGYDALGNRTHFWNAEFKPMTFGVDAQGRVTSITNAIQKVTSFTYDAAGNLFSRGDAEGAETFYGYDALNRLVAVTNSGVEVASFDHDNNGNIVAHASPLASCTFGYDDLNRLASSTCQVSSVAFQVANSYDLNGNRTNIVYPGGLTVGYAFGADNRLEGVTTKYAGNTKTVSFGYDTASRLTGISYPNGVASTFGLDAEGRVTSIQHGNFVDRTIQRNALGFKETELIDAGLKPTAPDTRRSIKTHNDADQLVSESIQTDGTNWTSVAYSYSANGGLTNNSETGQSLDYDYDNRLLSVNEIKYLYDASGARVGRIDGTTTNYFVIDYTDGLKRPFAETDAAGTVTRYYVWSGSQLLCHIEANGDVRYYHSDELGSTLALTDSSGSVTDQFAYMPYGYAVHQPTTPNAPCPTPYLWLGGYGVYYDSDTELHLTLYRAYSSQTKRFIHPDPLGIDGGVNVYMWANMNPLAFVDPYGLEAGIPWGSIAGNSLWGAAKAQIPALAAAEIIVATGNEYIANYQYTDNHLHAANLTLNPALRAGMGWYENYTGEGIHHYNSGDQLSYGEQILSGIDATANTVATIAVAGGLTPAARGLTTPSKYFGNKTAQEVSEAMTKKFGTPKSVREGAETFYNPKTQRSFNVHTDPAHGPPHVDIRRRGGFPERKYPLREETP